jgi:hypothetical protein
MIGAHLLGSPPFCWCPETSPLGDLPSCSPQCCSQTPELGLELHSTPTQDVLASSTELLGGPLVGGHTDSDQAESLQLAYSAGQGYHCWHLRVHWFFNPSRVVLGKMADERRKAGLVILTVEPLLMRTLERRFQGKVEETVVRTSLFPNTTYHLSFGGAGLVLLDEIVLE